MGKLTSNATINFSALGETSADGTLSIALDSEYNTEVYNVASKSTFAPGQTAYLRVLREEGAYTIESSFGSVSVVATEIQYTETETVSFAGSATGSLSKVPTGAVTWRWLGKDGGAPQFNGRSITLNKGPVVGVLYCEYKVNGDRIALDVTTGQFRNETMSVPVVVVATQNDNSVSATVTYSLDSDEGGGDVEPVATNIKVLSYCDDTIVVGASVYVNGQPKGVTNNLGICYVGELNPGEQYSLLVTKDEFVSSDQDILANDMFVISV